MYIKVDYNEICCAYCNTIFKPNRKDKIYCKDSCQKLASVKRQPDWRLKRQLKKAKYRKGMGVSCERCGFVAVHPAQLDVHHKDLNHSNNEKENLETLCANCHRLEHVK